jgi:acyl-CoA synthetase (NDP forming)
MAQACLAFSLLPPRIYRGITVAGGGGALGVAACDMAEAYGLSLPHLEGDIYEAVLSCLPRPGSSAANPIDVANPYVPAHMIREALIQAAKDERVDIQIQAPLLYHFKALGAMMGMKSFQQITPYLEMAAAAGEVIDVTGKPVVVVLPNPRREIADMDVEELLRQARAAFLEKGIPVFDTLSDAMRAIHHVSMYYQNLMPA